ncbi:MAG: pyruvate kinase [Candidatus Xenobia bacterium]
MRPTRTRIVCTIGPVSCTEEMLRSLIGAGMDVARLNFSHGTHEWHAERIELIRRVAQELGEPVAILQDLCGPKIRLGKVAEGTVLTAGAPFALTTEECEGDARRATITYPSLPAEARPGDPILLDDGLLELVVTENTATEVRTRVVEGGPLSSRKGVNLPNTRLSVPAMTEKDAVDLRFGLEHGVDYVALSFVRQASDLVPVRAIMSELGIYRPVVVKIEKREAVDNLESIVAAADAIMVARGDLGIEVPIEEVPIIQKRTIRLCRRYERPVITATQMLDSMIRNPRPTRAEATDVANAILDGTDAVMLSGETASGQYPLQSVQVMDRIAREAEQLVEFVPDIDPVVESDSDHLVNSVALGTCRLAQQLKASAILACTTSGRTVQAIARHRPGCLVVGITAEPEIARQLNLVFGVRPLVIAQYATTEELMHASVQAARAAELVHSGDTVVLAAGFPPGSPTNLVQVAQLGT